MPKVPKKSAGIWYQVEERNVNKVNKPPVNEFIRLCNAIKETSELSCPADALILEAKKIDEQEYTALNANFFRSECRSDFSRLVEKFNITEVNPIKVTLPAITSENQKLRDQIQELTSKMTAMSVHSSQGTSSATATTATTSITAQAPSNEIHVRHNDRTICFQQKSLDDVGASTVDDLNEVIKFQLKKDIENLSDKVITLRRGENEVLSSETRIDRLYNTQSTALHIIVADTPLISLNVNVVNTGSQMHRENLEKAFNTDYVDDVGMINKFITYLNCKQRTWKNNTHSYVPYSTIFQSSGYGKSRLVKEVAKKVPTIYLCLRDANSTGYPPRTSVGADLLIQVLGNLKEGEEWRFLYVLQVAIQCFKEELTKCKNNAEFWDKQMDAEFCEIIWDKIRSESKDWKKISQNELIRSADFLTENTTDDNVCLLFCIDEARVLISSTDGQSISPFRSLRRALKKIKWIGFFILFLDTLSKISNFVPPKSADPSSRDTSDLPLKLFYPYFRLTTMDVFKSSDAHDNESWNLAKFGRPLYMSYLQSCNNDPNAIDKLKNLLRRKLLGGVDNFESSEKEISSLAILSSVIGLDMSPQSQLASELVASHMATCLSVSEDRERLIIAYPSEPLLSGVALEYMSDLMLPKILRLFNTSLKKGLVEPGPRGELVGRIILAAVAHKLSASGPENTVQKFLTELYQEDSLPLDLSKFSDEFVNGTVAFTHFNVANYVPEKEDLKEFYVRRCAFIMKRNHPGADICIPVHLKAGKYSMIIIQIKNIDTTSLKADNNYPASAKSMLHCDYVFQKSDLKDHKEQCLCLYWQLGCNNHYQEEPSTVSTRSGQLESNNLHWATFGLTHYKIDGIADILNDILTSHISPFDSEWKVNNEDEGDTWNGNEIKIMHPLGYGKFKENNK